ncbi:MAG: hypothetical protein B7Z80_16925 [Rhodospirillales bacterium 20-64-7]|nr:MAG: hypothetical protein B7Z80_16925 [Rhodospirillales bacterium 20-64-7]
MEVSNNKLRLLKTLKLLLWIIIIMVSFKLSKLPTLRTILRVVWLIPGSMAYCLRTSSMALCGTF